MSVFKIDVSVESRTQDNFMAKVLSEAIANPALAQKKILEAKSAFDGVRRRALYSTGKVLRLAFRAAIETNKYGYKYKKHSNWFGLGVDADWTPLTRRYPANRFTGKKAEKRKKGERFGTIFPAPLSAVDRPFYRSRGIYTSLVDTKEGSLKFGVNPGLRGTTYNVKVFQFLQDGGPSIFREKDNQEKMRRYLAGLGLIMRKGTRHEVEGRPIMQSFINDINPQAVYEQKYLEKFEDTVYV